MSSSEVETILARLDKIESSLDQLRQTTSQLSQTTSQLQLTTAKLEGTNETIQKMLGGGLVLVGVLAAAGLLRVFLP